MINSEGVGIKLGSGFDSGFGVNYLRKAKGDADECTH